MNCCDDFGDCRQGRDCPARPPATTATPAADPAAELYDDTGLLICQGLALALFAMSFAV